MLLPLVRTGLNSCNAFQVSYEVLKYFTEPVCFNMKITGYLRLYLITDPLRAHLMPLNAAFFLLKFTEKSGNKENVKCLYLRVPFRLAADISLTLSLNFSNLKIMIVGLLLSTPFGSCHSMSTFNLQGRQIGIHS